MVGPWEKTGLSPGEGMRWTSVLYGGLIPPGLLSVNMEICDQCDGEMRVEGNFRWCPLCVPDVEISWNSR